MPSWWKWLYMYVLETYAERIVGSTPTEGTHIVIVLFI